MMYEPRKKKRRRHPIRWALLKFVFTLLLIAALALGALAGALYIAPMSVFLLDPGRELSINSQLPVSHMNVLLLGVDAENNGQRSDSMMILSVGNGDMVLTSLMRDMVVDIPGRGSEKLNAAYAHGGADLAMQTVNESLQMNVCKYVQVDYLGLVHAVDALGGINVSITEAERDKINQLVADRQVVLERDGYWIQPLTAYGEDALLNGIQALAYSRIRKLDSDYNRTGRQRQVIEAMWKKLRTGGVSMQLIADMWNVLREDVQTNLTWIELLGIGMKALRADGIEMHRLPAEGTYEDDGSALHIDASANANVLWQWIYGPD